MSQLKSAIDTSLIRVSLIVTDSTLELRKGETQQRIEQVQPAAYFINYIICSTCETQSPHTHKDEDSTGNIFSHASGWRPDCHGITHRHRRQRPPLRPHSQPKHSRTQEPKRPDQMHLRVCILCQVRWTLRRQMRTGLQ